MKKYFIIVLCALMLAASAFGCTNRNAAEFELDVFAAGDRLLNGCKFDSKPEVVEAEHAVNMFKLDSSIIVQTEGEYQVFTAICGGESPEMIVIAEAKTESDAKAICEGAFKDEVQYYKEGFEQYGPEQVPKIDSCINRSQGRYAFLIISADNAEAGKLLDSIIKDASAEK